MEPISLILAALAAGAVAAASSTPVALTAPAIG